MPSLPPLPPWEGMHPLVVHFPIALLMVAPIFVVVSAVSGSRAFMLSTLLLMILGAAGAFAATNSGDAANGAVDFESMTGYEVAEEHGEVAEKARNIFVGLTIVYAVLVGLMLGFEKVRKLAPRLVLNLLFLLPWAYGLVVLAEAAHLGGHLVHEFGGKALLGESLEVTEEEDEFYEDDATEDDAADAPETEAPLAGEEGTVEPESADGDQQATREEESASTGDDAAAEDPSN